MKIQIAIDGIAKETEKAICFVVPVSYNSNKSHNRNIWFPKSLIGNVIDNFSAEIEDWFLNKLSFENAFHGYTMSFDTYFHRS